MSDIEFWNTSEKNKSVEIKYQFISIRPTSALTVA